MTRTRRQADCLLDKIIYVYDDYHDVLDVTGTADISLFAEDILNILADAGGRIGRFYFSLDKNSKARWAIRQIVAERFLLGDRYCNTDDFVARENEDCELAALAMLGLADHEIADMLETRLVMARVANDYDVVELTDLILFLCCSMNDDELLDFLWNYVYPSDKNVFNTDDYSFDLVEFLLRRLTKSKREMEQDEDACFLDDDMFIMSEAKDIDLLNTLWENEIDYCTRQKALTVVCRHINTIFPYCSQDGKDKIYSFICHITNDPFWLYRFEEALLETADEDIMEIGQVLINIGRKTITDIQGSRLPEQYFESCCIMLDFACHIRHYGQYYAKYTTLCSELIEYAGYIHTDIFITNLKNMLYSSAREWAQMPQLFEDESNTQYIRDYIRMVKWLSESEDANNKWAPHFESRLIKHLVTIIGHTKLECRMPLATLILNCSEGMEDDPLRVSKLHQQKTIGSADDKNSVISMIKYRLNNISDISLNTLLDVKLIIEDYADIYNNESNLSLHGTESSMLRLIHSFVYSVDEVKNQYINLEELLNVKLIPLFAEIISRSIRNNVKDDEFFYSVSGIISAVKYTDADFEEYAYNFINLIRSYFDKDKGVYDRKLLGDYDFRRYLYCGYDIRYFSGVPADRFDDDDEGEYEMTDRKFNYNGMEDIDVMYEYDILEGFTPIRKGVKADIETDADLERLYSYDEDADDADLEGYCCIDDDTDDFDWDEFDEDDENDSPWSWMNDGKFGFPHSVAFSDDDDDDCIIYDDDIELSDLFDDDEAIGVYC